MNFKDWFYTEQGTSTACIAVFSRPIFGGEVTRTFPDFIGNGYHSDEDKKKKHKKRKKEEWNQEN